MPSAHRSVLFVSSVQKEFSAERRELKRFVEADPLLSRFFEVFLFEDTPASARSAAQVYLDEVARCALYVGLFGRDYGYEDGEGISPTEREFDHATALGKDRLVFIWGPDAGRHPKMQALIARASEQVTWQIASTLPQLTAALQSSLVERLTRQGIIQSGPFEDGPCATAHASATLADLSPAAVAAFVRRARAERQFPLPENAPLATVLAHLHLLAGDTPSRAAVLLFGREPTGWLSSAEIRCMHFHGTEVARPVPLYQVFKGTVFEQVDLATNFVLSVINRSVGTRALSSAAPVAYELPPEVVREAIVNALAHRDYASAAAVQVSVFADRVEIRNPGGLTPPLTPEKLRHPHPSLTRNAHLCEALFLARYIEKFGTGTLMMIRESREHALAAPDFSDAGGEFVLTLWRDWLTDKVLGSLGLNARQTAFIPYLKIQRKVTNLDYQRATGAIDRTATRDLDDLTAKGVLQKVGRTGRGAHYLLAAKPDINPTNTTAFQPDKNATFAGSSSQRGAVAPVKTRVETPEKSLRAPVKTPEQILAVLTANPAATLAAVAARIGKSPSAVERAAAKLVKAGRLRHIGPAKGGHWEVARPPSLP
ncbi:MAG TPA: ATP-binding protein [Opitutaceae bacterium]|nr:ATP-binding protein [Opitutaceae bacterium]